MVDHAKKCFSRRDVLRLMSGSVVSVPLLAAVSSTHAQEKLSREQARYQDSPRDGQRCSGCALFVAPSSCTVVSGAVSPDGWCSLFVPTPQ
jgi:hypothetical protein